MCDKSKTLWKALRSELPIAMHLGDWEHFDELRKALEEHFSGHSLEHREEDSSQPAS